MSKYIKECGFENDEDWRLESKLVMHFYYPYCGASCWNLIIESYNNGAWLKVYNDYNEMIYAGFSSDFPDFLKLLKDKQFA